MRNLKTRSFQAAETQPAQRGEEVRPMPWDAGPSLRRRLRQEAVTIPSSARLLRLMELEPLEEFDEEPLHERAVERAREVLSYFVDEAGADGPVSIFGSPEGTVVLSRFQGRTLRKRVEITDTVTHIYEVTGDKSYNAYSAAEIAAYLASA